MVPFPCILMIQRRRRSKGFIKVPGAVVTSTRKRRREGEECCSRLASFTWFSVELTPGESFRQQPEAACSPARLVYFDIILKFCRSSCGLDVPAMVAMTDCRSCGAPCNASSRVQPDPQSEDSMTRAASRRTDVNES